MSCDLHVLTGRSKGPSEDLGVKSDEHQALDAAPAAPWARSKCFEDLTLDRMERTGSPFVDLSEEPLDFIEVDRGGVVDVGACHRRQCLHVTRFQARVTRSPASFRPHAVCRAR